MFRKYLCFSFIRHTVLIKYLLERCDKCFLGMLYDVLQNESGNAGDNGCCGVRRQDLFYAWSAYSEDPSSLLKYGYTLVLHCPSGGNVRIVHEQIPVSTL